jgi:hypothetical protein
MSIILEEVGNTVCIYADEPFSIILHEYITNTLKQQSIYSEKAIAIHNQYGTDVHTAIIEVLNANINNILQSITNQFHGELKEIEGKYYIRISN